jgi:hypothetical protein
LEDLEAPVAALKALGCFTVPEIAPVLPAEFASLYIREKILEANDTLVLDKYSFILEKLARFEVSNMHRGLFKEVGSKNVVDSASKT